MACTKVLKIGTSVESYGSLLLLKDVIHLITNHAFLIYWISRKMKSQIY